MIIPRAPAAALIVLGLSAISSRAAGSNAEPPLSFVAQPDCLEVRLKGTKEASWAMNLMQIVPESDIRHLTVDASPYPYLDRIGWNDDISLTFDLPGFKMPKIASSDRRSSQDSDSNFHFELWQLLKRDPPIPGHEIREGRFYVLQPPENAQKKFKNGQKSFVAAVFYWDSQAGAPYTVSRVPPASATLVA